MSIEATEKRLLDYIEAHRQALFDGLADLIHYDTTNYISRGDEAECAAHIRELYQGLGLETDLYYPDDWLKDSPEFLSGRGTDARPNVGGLYRGTEGTRSVMLAAHIDTMPVGDRSLWTVDPFSGEVRDGRLYGRGCGDDKAGIACGIFLLEALRALGIRLKQNVVLSAYCDEEYGGGNGSLASCYRYPCDMYINLDGGNFHREVWTCAIGGQVIHVNLKTREPQDSVALVADGINVVRREVEAFGQRRRAELQAHRFYRDSDMQRSALKLTGIHCGNEASNLECGRFEFVFYTVSPREDIQRELRDMEEKLRAELDAMGIDFNGFEPASRYFDYICADENDPSIRLLLDCSSEVAGKPIVPAGACLSDYFLYYLHGSPCSVTCGVLRDFKLPGGAHQTDEFISCEEFVNLTKSLALFLLRWCGVEES